VSALDTKYELDEDGELADVQTKDDLEELAAFETTFEGRLRPKRFKVRDMPADLHHKPATNNWWTITDAKK
jgi:hypothetical protein